MNLIGVVTCRLAVLSPTHIAVYDDSDKHKAHPGAKNGAHLRLDIVSEKFCGLSALQRHRLVHESVGDFFRFGVTCITNIGKKHRKNRKNRERKNPNEKTVCYFFTYHSRRRL